MDIDNLDNQIKAYLDANWSQMLEDIRALVSIKSVEDLDSSCTGSPFGEGPRRALDATLNIAQRMGFETHDLDGYIGIADFAGKTRDQLAIIGHVDVVVQGSGWHFDPFDITQKDGYLIGRGTTDDKAPFLIAMHAVKFWMDLGASFPYTIRMLIGANEETQMADVKKYLSYYTDPAFVITPDAEFPVCYGEKGVINIWLTSKKIEEGYIGSIEGGTAINAIPGFASAVVLVETKKCPHASNIEILDLGDGTTRIRAIGKSAHASTPELGINAIGILIDYLLQNNLCNSDERDYLQLMKSCIDNTDGSGIGLECCDKDFGSLTLACGIVDKRNSSLMCTLDARFPTTTNADKIYSIVSEEASKIGATTKTTMFKEPFVCNPKSPAVQALLDAYNEVTGENAKPFTMGGGTYARMFEHGASFGIEKPWVKKPDWVGGMHGPDEAVSIDALKEEFCIYVKTIYKLMEIDLGHNGPMPLARLSTSINVCEGAMGTMIQKMGKDITAGTIRFNLDDPGCIASVHQKYLEAGATCAITNSFEPCVSVDCEQLKRAKEQVCASAKIPRDCGYDIVLGDVGPASCMVEPLGTTSFDEQYLVYYRHIKNLLEAGVDAILLETFIDIADARCALLAAKDAAFDVRCSELHKDKCDVEIKTLPVIMSFSFDKNMRMPLSSTTPQIAAYISELLGADVVGTNCGLGPNEILQVICEMSASTTLPLIVQPNAGMPEVDRDGNTHYPGTPQEMVKLVLEFANLGCTIIGSCCGSTPDFTREIANEVRALGATQGESKADRLEQSQAPKGQFMLTSAGSCVVSKNGQLDCSDALFIDCDSGLDKWEILENTSAAPVIFRYCGNLESLEFALKLYPGIAVICVGSLTECLEVANLAKRYGANIAFDDAGGVKHGELLKAFDVSEAHKLNSLRLLKLSDGVLSTYTELVGAHATKNRNSNAFARSCMIKELTKKDA